MIATPDSFEERSADLGSRIGRVHLSGAPPGDMRQTDINEGLQTLEKVLETLFAAEGIERSTIDAGSNPAATL